MTTQGTELDQGLAELYGVETRRLMRECKERLGKHDQQLAAVFEALRQLISPTPRTKRRVGFGIPEEHG